MNTPVFALADAIAELRRQLEHARSARVEGDMSLPIESVVVELEVAAVVDGKGEISFSVPILGVGVAGGGGASSETTHRVTVRFGTPQDATGRPLRVAQDGAQALL
jgi:hypothetical protein